jgi:hypothetical protein
MRTRRVFLQMTSWNRLPADGIDQQGCRYHVTLLALSALFVFVAFSAMAADSGITTFQESSAPSSENTMGLIGHWRKTTIGYTGR